MASQSPLSGRIDSRTLPLERLPLDHALRVALQLAEQIQDLHRRQLLHRHIVPEEVSCDDGLERVELSVPASTAIPFGGRSADSNVSPPELQSSVQVDLPQDIPECVRLLSHAGIGMRPERVDIYQLGVLFCQLLSGSDVNSYLRSPRAKAAVPQAVQPILEGALGHRDDWRFNTAEQLLNELRHVVSPHSVPSEAKANSAEERSASMSLESETEGQQVSASEGRPQRDSQLPDTSPSYVSRPGDPGTSVDGRAARRNKRPAPEPLQSLGHYEIVSLLGQGGMGEVYKAYERALDRTVALKVLAAELAGHPDFVHRFRTEAMGAARLVHPNIVQIFYIGEDQQRHYFAMQYVEGESLAELLVRRQRLGLEETLAILEQVLSGLAAAHDQGLIHRDVKPGNILLDRRRRRALLADFGLVKLTETARGLTATGTVMGTADYISPEQGRGKVVDRRADLYSLGVVAYQMLSGQLPFESDNFTTLIFKHVYEAPPDLQTIVPDLPETVVQLVHKLLAKSPDDRFPDAGSVLQEVRALREGRAPATLQAFAAVEERPGSGSATVDSRSMIIVAPQLEEHLLSELLEPPPTGVWSRIRSRAAALFQRHAPEVVKQWQSTQQQVDAAVDEYGRRVAWLQELLSEAEQIQHLLSTQAQTHRAAAAAAANAEVSSEAERDARLEEQLRLERAAVELEAHAEQQSAQIDPIRQQLAQARATLLRLRGQRDLLSARLNAALAKAQAAGARYKPPVRGRRLRLAAVLAVLMAVPIFIVWNLPSQTKLPKSFREWIALVLPRSMAEPDSPDAHLAKLPRELPLRQFIGAEKYIREVEFSPDGKWLATAGTSSDIVIWDVASAQIKHRLASRIVSEKVIAFSASSERLLVNRGQNLELIDVESGTSIRRFGGNLGAIVNFAFHPDGKHVAVIHERSTNSVKIWDCETGSEERTLDPGELPLRSVRYHPRGKHLAILFADNEIRLWDAERDQFSTVERPADTKAFAKFITFSPDGLRLAVAFNSNLIALHEALSGKRVGTIVTPVAENVTPLFAPQFSPDGRQLVLPMYGGSKSLNVL